MDEKALRRERTRPLGEIRCVHTVPLERDFELAHREAQEKLLTAADERGADFIVFGDAIEIPRNGTVSVHLSAEIYADESEW